jgi:2Fe-2S ferredoxin
MPKISITSLNKEIFCSPGSQTILSAIQQNSIDWMHACGAKGRCTTCSIIILEGEKNLNDLTRSEQVWRERSLLDKKQRLACQSTLDGDITIQIPEENKLPHLEYFD